MSFDPISIFNPTKASIVYNDKQGFVKILFYLHLLLSTKIVNCETYYLRYISSIKDHFSLYLIVHFVTDISDIEECLVFQYYEKFDVISDWIRDFTGIFVTEKNY